MIVIFFALIALFLIYKYTCGMGNHKFVRYKNTVMCEKCKAILNTQRGKR